MTEVKSEHPPSRALRIILVDDDASILESTSLALRAEGYDVEALASGQRALDIVRARPPDLVVLDVMMPGLDGFEVCREIRKFSGLPIILLTAKSDTVDVVVGLEIGADDYVTKPFDLKELVARIRALLRRLRSPADPIVRVGPLEIKPAEGVVLKGGGPLALTKTEFLLLCTMASHVGRVWSREQLLQEVWGYDYFGDTRLVDVNVRRLRAKLEDDPATPVLVRTVRGLGYRLAAE